MFALMFFRPRPEPRTLPTVRPTVRSVRTLRHGPEKLNDSKNLPFSGPSGSCPDSVRLSDAIRNSAMISVEHAFQRISAVIDTIVFNHHPTAPIVRTIVSLGVVDGDLDAIDPDMLDTTLGLRLGVHRRGLDACDAKASAIISALRWRTAKVFCMASGRTPTIFGSCVPFALRERLGRPRHGDGAGREEVGPRLGRFMSASSSAPTSSPLARRTETRRNHCGSPVFSVRLDFASSIRT